MRVKKNFNDFSITEKKDTFKKFAFFATIILCAFALRFIHLGYSNYQGDEIKAMFFQGEKQTSFEFLLNQKKGPGQFLVTRAIEVINPNYKNHFISRLPFALASLLSVILFFLFVKNLFNDWVAFFSAFFFTTNGIIIGLSRIVQYQSLVFFFSTLSLASLVFALKKSRFRIYGLYISLISWSLALLSHYDGIFIAPMMLYLIYEWIKQSTLEAPQKNKHLLISSAISFSLLALFYIPYTFSISQSNWNYLISRMQVDPSKENPGSFITFNIYQPIYVFYLYIGLATLSFTLILLSFLKSRDNKIKAFIRVPELLSNKMLTTSYVLILWFLFPYVYMEGVVYIPGTHIYNYLFPLFIIMGIGLWLTISFINSFISTNLGTVIKLIGISSIFFLLFTQSYSIFVDHHKEYPWESKRYLFWIIDIPSDIREKFDLKLFGFPHYRNWEGINRFLANRSERSDYISNEKEEISRFYLNLPKADNDYVHMIYVRNPQTRFINFAPEFSKLLAEKDPIFTYRKNDRIYSAIYYIPKEFLTNIQ